MAHAKLRGVEEVDAELFADWVQQARKLVVGI